MIWLSPNEAAAKLSVSRSTLYNLAKSPDFPRPVYVSSGRRAWIAEELEEWMERRAAERGAGANRARHRVPA